uniref:ShKT domain-containing protein n=1 Tax=Loa loa TaxID=7209 RepID=A0A1I7VAR3_LOALO
AEVGKEAVKALENVYGTKFRLGTGADILYPSSGGSDDWAKSKAGVKFVYLLELRPGENDFDGFLLDRRQLIPTGRETWAGVRVVIDAITRTQRAIGPGVTINSGINAINESKATVSIFSTSRFPLRHSSKTATIAPSLLMSPPTVPIKSQSLLPTRIDYKHRLRNFQRKQGIIRRKLPYLQNKICTDISPWCANWIHISSNICLKAATYMQQQCTRSCRFC